MVFLISCQTDVLLPDNSEAEVRNSVTLFPTTPSGPGQTELGDELLNPYDLNNMNATYATLTRSQRNLTVSHYYVKLQPSSGDHVMQIVKLEESKNYEFELQPLHFEELYIGDDGYIDPSVPQTGGFAPEYGAITFSDYQDGVLNEIPHEILNEMLIAPYETRLTFIAYVMSGNEKDYEAVDGACHPDCPSLPSCLEDVNLTCIPTDYISSDDIQSLDPNFEYERVGFPNYLMDDALGMNGQYRFESDGCLRIVNRPEDLNCEPECWPILQMPGLGGICYWDCYCPPVIDPDDPPAGQIVQCDCFVYNNKKKSGGSISVEDTQLGEEGIRRVKVKATKRYWGFIWRNTDTDDNGCWRINKVYNVKRAKVKAVFKDRESDRVVIRSVRGIRVWNGFLKPVKHKWRLKRTNKSWHSLCLLIPFTNDADSKAEQSHVSATVNNALHEYHDTHLDLPTVNGELRVLIQNWQATASAPMFEQMGSSNFTLFDFNKYLVNLGAVLVPQTNIIWSRSKPDVIMSLGQTRNSDAIKRTMYHELAHTSQFTELGNDWWKDYVQYILDVPDDQPGPYGDGSRAGAGMAEITEVMAEGIGQFITDLEYATNHSFGHPDFARPAFIMEQRGFWTANFIPEGLFWDLFDDNGVFPLSGAEAPNELLWVNDQVNNFTFEQIMEALDSDDDEIIEYRDALWNLHGVNSGNTNMDYLQLYQSYGF